MNISSILINHITEPIGFDFNSLRIDFKIEADSYSDVETKLILSTGNQTIYETDFIPFTNNFFEVNIPLKPRTRYDVHVQVRSLEKTVFKQSFFETGKMTEPFSAKWIANPDKNIQNTLFRSAINITKTVKSERLYITALGI